MTAIRHYGDFYYIYRSVETETSLLVTQNLLTDFLQSEDYRMLAQRTMVC